MAVLRVRKGGSPGGILPVHESDQPTILGRDPGVSIPLDDDRASRKHARIRRLQGAWIIEDLKSSNGTLLGGAPIDRAPLADGATVQIGATLLTFSAEEVVPPPEVEIYGTQLIETLHEEGGVVSYRAYQAALDREVRIDHLWPRWALPATTLDEIDRAASAALEVQHDGILPLVHVRVTEQEDVKFVVHRLEDGRRLDRSLDEVLRWPLAVRLRLLAEIADVILCRARSAELSTPIALHQFTIRASRSRALVAVPALDVAALVTARTHARLHLPWYVPFLAPEAAGDATGPLPRPALVYSLGALAYLLLGRVHAMGRGNHREILERHRDLSPAPLELIADDVPPAVSRLVQAMLDKDPGARPDGSEIREILDAVRDESALPPEEDATEESTGPASTGITARSPDPAELPAARSTRTAPVSPSSPRGRPAEAAARAGQPRRQPASSASSGASGRPRPVSEPPRAGAGAGFFGGLLALPVWMALWVGIFFAARLVTHEILASVTGR